MFSFLKLSFSAPLLCSQILLVVKKGTSQKFVRLCCVALSPDDVEADLLPVPILWFQERDPRKDIMLLSSLVVTRKFFLAFSYICRAN